MYIVSTASPELRLYKRGGSVTERCCRSLHRRLPSGTPCPRVRLVYSLCQPRVVYYLPTPLILTIDCATSCRLFEYICLAATTPRLVTIIRNSFSFNPIPIMAYINTSKLKLIDCLSRKDIKLRKRR